MHMIGHQAIAQQPHSLAGALQSEQPTVSEPAVVVEEGWLAVVAPLCEVVRHAHRHHPSQSGQSGQSGAALYSADQLGAVPDAARLASAGCGNPVAIAELAPGEAVLDLGSGGGIDCFLASRQVGPGGTVWGLDMTPDMVQLARHNAETVGAVNVRFRLGEIEDIPFPDGSFDAVISNCVINLTTDKPQVFREAFRVLKPGGRVRVSDMVLTAELPPEQRADLEAWAGCVAGALPLEDYLDAVRAAGFSDVRADAGEEHRPGIASAYVTAVRPA